MTALSYEPGPIWPTPKASHGRAGNQWNALVCEGKDRRVTLTDIPDVDKFDPASSRAGTGCEVASGCSLVFVPQGIGCKVDTPEDEVEDLFVMDPEKIRGHEEVARATLVDDKAEAVCSILSPFFIPGYVPPL